ncbi:SLC13 family permease [Testudinibacter sp. TR-2022]|uniref:SLC13 family permease n=1 Tax=Testudinibacter sp. TR-2022 TaxID=2585029 RepID=UPI00111AB994|nr:SLC13 family permease [Testudinibacter sp. TR-2022]TNH07243.1 hypothetical protein FHQ30_04640 [Pasteurellaceae bacterium Phil11]TNH21113.1 hypothetical protein FHQ29_10650 [Testudinibacter sp. TR-2022]TNH27792.1 hypothetical protein FHQ27_04495 [Testudinibacter sp. TR-2022]
MLSFNVIILLFIVLSIAGGYFFKINIGIFAIVFSFIAAYIYGLNAKDVSGLWGLNLFFILLSITFFYGIVIANGTLSLVAEKMVFAVRNQPFLIPIVLFVTVVIFAGIGPGHYAAFAFMSPLVMVIASKINMSRLLAAIIIYSGAVAGGFNPFTLGGRVTEGLIEKLGYSVEISQAYALTVGRNSFVIHTLIFIFGYILLKGYQVTSAQIEQPKLLNNQQKRTLALVALIFLLVIVPSVLLALNPESLFLSKMTKMLDPTFLSFLGIVLALVLKLGNENEAMKNIPWSIIIMIGGLGMLTELASKAGAMTALSNYLNSIDGSTGGGVIYYLVAAFSSMMSVFASSMGVVMPTFYPIVPNLHVDNPGLMFSIITMFATFTGYSPFSSGGALVMAGLTDPKESKQLFIRLLILPFLLLALGYCLLYIGVLY